MSTYGSRRNRGAHSGRLRWPLAAWLALVAVVFAFSAMAAVPLLSTDVDSHPEPLTVDATPQIVAAWLFLGVTLAVIGSQYDTRRLRRAVFIAVVGVVLSVVVADAWPWRFARAAEPDPGAWARDERRVALTVEDEQRYVSDAFGTGRGSAPRKQIALPLHLTGVPPDFQIQTTAVRGRLEFLMAAR